VAKFERFFGSHEIVRFERAQPNEKRSEDCGGGVVESHVMEAPSE
jgi:hypothetical protein